MNNNLSIGSTRESILNHYGSDKLKKCWELFSRQIIKNYQTGKGTVLNSFGTFTFTDADVNLEGTTNQLSRDLKARRPVFIVRPEFLESLKPGIYTQRNGIVYYNQKKTNSVSVVKANFAEIAYSLSISKDEVATIFNHLIQFLSEQIRKGELKNKEMPDLGVLMLRNNIIAVKFNDYLVENVKNVPEKLANAKKNVQLYMETNNKMEKEEGMFNRTKGIGALTDTVKTLNKLRPNSAVVTKITRDGEAWLKENLDIDLNNIEEEKFDFKTDDFNDGTQFINDVRVTATPKLRKLSDIKIPDEVLHSIFTLKEILVSSLKAADKLNSGVLTRHTFIHAFLKPNLHIAITSELIGDLITLYCNEGDNVAYLKLITSLLKDIRQTLHIEGKNITISRPQTSRNSTAIAAINRVVSLEQVEKEIRAIKLIFEQIKTKHSTRLDQSISLYEFASILREYSIIIPTQKMKDITTFIELTVPFTLKQFEIALSNCKVLANEISTADIRTIITKLKDIIYSLGGKTIMFNQRTTVTKVDFLNLFLQKTHFSYDVLNSVYDYIVKTSRDFTSDDYDKFFTNKTLLSDEFTNKAKDKIIQTMKSKTFKPIEYFDHLLYYNPNRGKNVLSPNDFHKVMLKEKLGFTAEEVDWIFTAFDSKKDGIIDLEEFLLGIKVVSEPLFKLKDIIKKNNLEIEDLCYRMQIDPKFNETFDFWKFKAKIKLLDSTYSNEFINSLFLELANGGTQVDTKKIIAEFNVFHKEHFRNLNNDSFKLNFMSEIKRTSEFSVLKEMFEGLDSYNNGQVTKIEFCNVIQKSTKEFKDEDIMKFVRICSLVSKENKIRYLDFLNLVFYDSKADKLTNCVEELKRFLIEHCSNDLLIFFTKMNNVSNGYSLVKHVSIDKLFEFLRLRVDQLERKTVCKFDLDKDGKVSIEDLKGVLDRYNSTSYFKYENKDDEQYELNLFANETLGKSKFKEIVKDIKTQMKSKNLTEVGLFNKLDTNHDGFVSHPEFNANIGKIIELSPAIKDQFFNYLDAYSLGMVDLDTFLKRFKEFESADVIVKSDTITEDLVMKEFEKWIKKTSNLSDTEIFAAIDYDSDGVINLDNFKRFLFENLNFSKNDLNDYKIERVMQRISITKNKNIGLGDIKEFHRKVNTGASYVDLKETFKQTNSQNCRNDTNWILEAIERLGLYISENFASLEEFCNEIAETKSKIKLKDFTNFIQTNHKCLEGFNLTNDEVLLLFTTLDSQKKNYISLEDLKNKLNLFEFYSKMHQDIKNFIKSNFPLPSDVFKYLKKEQTDKNFDGVSITKKELFDGLNQLFPGKYSTPTLLNYIDAKLTKVEEISFSDLTFIYYDEMKPNEQFLKERLMSSKINTNRPKSVANAQRPFSSRTNFNVSHPKLSTPFDSDALEKVKRIIHSSRFDFTSFFKMHEILSEGGFINQFEFRNMLKKLNLGITSLEIDQIISRAGKTRDGQINLKEFIRFITTEDPNILLAKKNLQSVLADIKQLVYKYYSTPKLAFQFNDKAISLQMDFEKFKHLITSLYTKDNKPTPNFALMKSIFDLVDLRKDGIIDLNEWLRAFAVAESSLDIKAPEGMKVLREWENSRNMTEIYSLISKNRKLIKERVAKMLLTAPRGEDVVVHADNLISAMKEIFPNWKLSNTQWRILVSIADRDRNSMIDYNLFIRLVEKSSNFGSSHPKIK